MTESEREREYLSRIGRLKAASHADALAAHLRLSLDERLQRSWELYERFRDARPDDTRPDEGRARETPRAFYDRARALGLYRE